MTTPVVGRVWIEYPADPAMPWGWRIYLEGTGKLMDDAVAIQISVEVNQRTVVDIRRMNMVGTERYELIAAPPAVHIPVQTMAGCTPPPTCGAKFNNHGPNYGGGGYVRPGVKYGPKAPPNLVADAVEQFKKRSGAGVLRQCRHCGLSSPDGGAHRSDCRGLMQPAPASTCDECGGTGEWENPANGKRSPCSRGCRP